MPIEWLAISVAVIPHIKRYVADQVEKLGSKYVDGVLGSAYRRVIPDEKLVIASVKLNQVVARLSFFWEQIPHFHFFVKMSRHSLNFSPLASPTGVTWVTNPLWLL